MTIRHPEFKIAAASLIFALMTLNPGDVLSSTTETKAKEERKPVVRVLKASSKVTALQKERFEKLFEEGKTLYAEMDYSAAVQKLTEAAEFAVTREQKSKVYFYLSLAHYTTLEEKGRAEFDEVVRKLIETEYNYELDKTLCPEHFIDLYHQIKAEYGVLTILSKPAGAEVFLDDSKISSGKTPLTVAAKPGTLRVRLRKGKRQLEDTIQVESGEETLSPVYKLKGRSSLLYILGGAAVAGGVVAALLAGGGSPNGKNGEEIQTGQIQVNSAPEGARIFLNSNDTGKVTNATLSDLTPGNYEIRLVLENYHDYDTTVSVSANQTSNIEASLVMHSISLISPKGGSVWVKGREVEIIWEINGSSANQADRQIQITGLSLSNPTRITAALMQRRAMQFRKGIYHQRDIGERFGRDSISNVSSFVSLEPQGRTEIASNSNMKVVEGIASPAKRPAGLHRNANIGARERRHKENAAHPADGNIGSGFSMADHSMVSKLSSPFRSVREANAKGKAKPAAISNIKIQLLEGDVTTTIAEEIENVGSFNWLVDPKLPVGKDYKVKVMSATDPDIFAQSQEFEIGLQKYKHLLLWGHYGALNGEFKSPAGIAVNRDGTVFVADYRNDRIQKFDSNGNFLAQWGATATGSLDKPDLISFDQFGYLYVADSRNARVVKYDVDGNYLGEFTLPGASKESYCGDAAIDSSGNVFVSDLNNNRIVKYDASGIFLDSWGGEGKGKYRYRGPFALEIDSNGNIYVSDRANHRIIKYDANFRYLLQWGSEGSNDDQFQFPGGMAIDNNDNIYVTDIENHRFLVFGAEGNMIAKWGSFGSGNDNLQTPIGIAVDMAGDVYVADNGNHRIVKLRPKR